MRKERKERIDPGQPALIVLAGLTRNKRRPLDSDIFLLGRASGCDLGLVSAEVAPVHCVILRVSRGWRIRDCTGRGATRINGKAIRDSALQDGDVIQVGSFSFEAYLPRSTAIRPGADEGADEAGQKRAKHRERSRRNLARHALRLRARLQADADAQAEAARRQADLERQEEKLRNRARELEERVAGLTQERAELEALRAELDRKRAEVILTGHPDDVADLQEQVRELERWGVELVRQNTAIDRRTVEQDRRAAELNSYARYLLRQRMRLPPTPPIGRVVEPNEPVEDAVGAEPSALDGAEGTACEANADPILPPPAIPEGEVNCT